MISWRAFFVLGSPGKNGLFLWKGVRTFESRKSSIILTADGKEVAEGPDSDEAWIYEPSRRAGINLLRGFVKKQAKAESLVCWFGVGVLGLSELNAICGANHGMY